MLSFLAKPFGLFAAVSITAAVVLLSTMADLQAQKFTADQIIDKFINSMGGMTAWRNLKDVTYRETRRQLGAGSERQPMTRVMYFKRNPRGGDNFFRIEQDGGTIEMRSSKRPPVVINQTKLRGKTVLAYDGREGWMMTGGKLETEPELLYGTRFVTEAFLYWFSLPFKLKDPGVILTYLDEDDFEGKKVYIVQASFEKGVGDHPTDGFIYYINAQTFRLENLTFWQRGPHAQWQYRWSDYVKIGEILKPLRHTFIRNGSRSERVWEVLAVNSGLPDSMFLKPK